jgi:hypothetical protein
MPGICRAWTAASMRRTTQSGVKTDDGAQVHRNITMALSTMLHFFIDIVVAFLFTIFMTELTKVATGVLR